MRNAHLDGVTRLYHYERFVPEYLTALLRNQQLHCSSPANLNDPWDCRPFFDTSLDEPKERELTMQWFEKNQRDAQISDQQRLQALEMMNNDPAFLLELVTTLSKQVVGLAVERWGIYCVTPFPASTLMWSHYGDNHRGICLEFASDNNRLFAGAFKVVYRSEYPRWSVHSIAESGHIPEILVTKSRDWEYEQEYRVLARLKESHLDSQDGGMLLAKNGFLSFPPEALISVITGCEADYGAVDAIVSEYAPGLTVKRAARVPNRYSLEIMG